MIDRVNRAVLLILGLLLCIAGVLGILVSQGSLPVLQPFEMYARLEQTVVSQPALWWTVIILAGVLLVLVGLWYAFRQIAVRAGRRLDTILLKRDDSGATRLEPAAVSRAVSRDLDRVDGVTGSRVRMRTYQPQPSVDVRLDVLDEADVQQVRAQADEAFERLRRTLGADGVETDVLLRLRPPPATTQSRVE